jgi:L-ascorbate oxidase
VPEIGPYVTNALVASAERAMPPAVAPAVIADLKAGLKLTRFTPHPDIAAGEVTGTQELTFFIRKGDPIEGEPTKYGPSKFEVGNTLNPDDAKQYDSNRLDRKLTLGGVDEWTIQSHLAGHPFHIHVNPFQIVSITDPNGKDVSAPGSIDDYNPPALDKPTPPDPQYAGLKGVWKDTLWIKSFLGTPNATEGVYTIKIRTRYERYIGEFVIHCHILDHEDQGMMQNVAVVLPDRPITKPPTGAATAPAGMSMDHH